MFFLPVSLSHFFLSGTPLHKSSILGLFKDFWDSVHLLSSIILPLCSSDWVISSNLSPYSLFHLSFQISYWAHLMNFKFLLLFNFRISIWFFIIEVPYFLLSFFFSCNSLNVFVKGALKILLTPKLDLLRSHFYCLLFSLSMVTFYYFFAWLFFWKSGHIWIIQ